MIRRLLNSWTDGPRTAGLLLALGVVLAFAPDVFLTMLARAFLVQWAVGFALLIVLFSWRKAWWSASAASAVLVLIVVPPRAGPPAAHHGAAILQVAQMNVLQPNTAHAEVVRAALASGAEMISFQEVSPRWATVLQEGLGAEYPYHTMAPQNNCYGIAVFSKRPFDARIRSLEGTPIVDAVVGTEQGPVRVLAVHAESPGSYGSFQRRNRQLEHLAELVRATDLPTVVIGDLNTVSWDEALRRFCARSGLREGQEAPDPTWPSLFGLALIPLDHVLVSPQLGISEVNTFLIPGSDHKGLVAHLSHT